MATGAGTGWAADSAKAEALRRLLDALSARGYAFTTPTPETAGRMFERTTSDAPSLRDIFGWSLPFEKGKLDEALFEFLSRAGHLKPVEQRWASAVRVSTVQGMLFAHSAFPATDENAVFLGPDTYRFADLIAHELSGRPPPRRVFDIGAGAGVGGILVARRAPGAMVELGDVNAEALSLAEANARHAGVVVELKQAGGLCGAAGDYDLIIANPPYIAGRSGRTYSDGGDRHGAALSLAWAQEAIPRLAVGGRLVMYTGSAILLGGRDAFCEAMHALAAGPGLTLRYREIDPDVFPDELRRPAYDDVERIAAVAAVVERRS